MFKLGDEDEDARALTKPSITDRGMKRWSLATPKRANTIWNTPANRTVAMK